MYSTSIYPPGSKEGPPDPTPAAEASLLKLVVIVARTRWRLARIVPATMLVTAGLVMLIPVAYTGTAVILAPQPSSSASALLNQIGSLASLAPELMQGSGGKTSEETYLGILSSRTISDEMIRRFDLQRLYRTRHMVDTRKALAMHTRVEATKGYLIRISVEDHSATRAADMANGYVDILYAINERLALTQSSQRRLFLEQQVTAERDVLSKAELAFKRVQELLRDPADGASRAHTADDGATTHRTGKPGAAVATLRSVATEQNEKVSEMESGLAALRAQLSKAEKGASDTQTSDYFLAAGKVPAAGLEYIRTTRDLRYHEALFEALSKQYEMARLEEAKAPALLQVIDCAVPLDKKTWPPRTLLVLISGLVSALVVLGWAFAQDAWRRARLVPANAEQLAILHSVLARRGAAHE